MKVLVWMHRDVRINDHPALNAALRERASIEVFFSYSKHVYGSWMPGSAQRWWLHEHLLDVAKRLAGLGIAFHVSRDAPESVAAQRSEGAVFWNEPLTPAARKAGQKLRAYLRKNNRVSRVFAGDLLHNPDRIQTRNGTPYRVFTPFYRTFREQVEIAKPELLPIETTETERALGEDRLFESARRQIESLNLVPNHPWVQKLDRYWTPGEVAAQARLSTFLGREIDRYEEDRNRPDLEGSSKLSPYLAIGAISPRQVWSAAVAHETGSAGRDTFLKELAWREFAYHLLYHFPETLDTPLNKDYLDFPWKSDEEGLEKWCRGETGFPIVDAGMRQLWETGWMHNRVRMITASFLTKDLLISWKQGAQWFWDTLIDADLANNTLGWQWAAGCGADAQPWFRIFNPDSQAKKHDPQGAYIRRFGGYMALEPMVDHARARKRALDVFGTHSKGNG